VNRSSLWAPALAAVLLCDCPDTVRADRPVRAPVPLTARLAAVQDRTAAFRPAERDLFRQLLQQACDADPVRLRSEADENIQRRRSELPRLRDNPQLAFQITGDLLRFPKRYRGQSITLTGQVRGLTQRSAKKGICGHTTLYDIRLFPSDSRTVPVRIVCLAVPTGFPMKQPVIDDVSVTGYFFKLARSANGENTPVTPVIIAKQIEWQSPRQNNRFDLDLSWLANVRDRTMGVRNEERTAYYQVLHKTTQIPYHRQQRAAAKNLADRRNRLPAYREHPGRRFPVFVDLFRNPQAYRGRLVTFHGYIRELKSYPADKNPYGLKRLYEVALFTEDSQTNPAIIVATEKPAGLHEGSDMAEPVTVTGYFFKMYGYTAHDTTRIAPLILADRFEWSPERPQTGLPRNAIIGILAGLAVVVLATVWYFTREARTKPRPIFPDDAENPFEP